MMLVLDTDALWHAPLMGALFEAKARGVLPHSLGVVVPIVAYAERCRQVASQGRPASLVGKALHDLGASVEPLAKAEADRVDWASVSDDLWKREARDVLIAAHVHGDRIGVTTDRGLAWRGVAVRSPAEATAAVRTLLREREGFSAGAR